MKDGIVGKNRNGCRRARCTYRFRVILLLTLLLIYIRSYYHRFFLQLLGWYLSVLWCGSLVWVTLLVAWSHTHTHTHAHTHTHTHT
jgi:hypothetical protein